MAVDEEDWDAWGEGELGEEDMWDDVSGARLNPGMVREARKEEMDEVHKHKIYVKVPVQQCWDETGKEPIGVR